MSFWVPPMLPAGLLVPEDRGKVGHPHLDQGEGHGDRIGFESVGVFYPGMSMDHGYGLVICCTKSSQLPGTLIAP